MNHRPVIFKVEVALEGNRKTLNIGRFLQDYLDKECVEGENLDIVILHQRKYCEIVMEPKEKIEIDRRIKQWECSCGTLHPSSDKECSVCGDEKIGKPYSKIHKEFGNMREQP